MSDTAAHQTPGVAQVTPHSGVFYLCFSQDTDPERARELYRHRFGTDPERARELYRHRFGTDPERARSSPWIISTNSGRATSPTG